LANEHKMIMATTNNKETAKSVLTEQYLNLNIKKKTIYQSLFIVFNEKSG
ncbi:unnamed protein product, partial [marine sediment metagenome]